MYKVKVPETHAEIPEIVKSLEQIREELNVKGEQELDSQFQKEDEETDDANDDTKEDDTKLEYNAEEADGQNWPTLS